MTHHTDAERAEFLQMLADFEREFGPMPQDCKWSGRGFYQTSHHAWKAQEYAHKFDGFKAAWQAARRTPAAPSAWKDNDTAKLVNDLRDCAVQYHATAQLRERIAHLVRPLAARLAGAPAAPVPHGWKLVPKEATPEMLEQVWYLGYDEMRDAYCVLVAAAPHPPEAGCSVSNGETQAASVQLPEPAFWYCESRCPEVTGIVGRTTKKRESAFKDGYFNQQALYTEQQVRELLAAHGIGKDKA